MPTVSYTKAHNPDTLMQELMAACPEWLVTPADGAAYCLMQPHLDGERITLTWPETLPTAISTVDAVVAAHDPTQRTPAQAQQQADDATLTQFKHDYQTLKQGITTIRADMDQILAGPATPTAAQTGQALKLLAKNVNTMLTGLNILLDDMEVVVRQLW